MDPKRWEQIDKLLEETLDRDPEQRAAFVAEASAGDDELRKAVEELLAALENAGSLGDTPPLELAAGAMADRPGPPLVGKRLGPYEILSPVGRGGMGKVYRARDTRLDRIDALKILPVEVAADPERIPLIARSGPRTAAGLLSVGRCLEAGWPCAGIFCRKQRSRFQCLENGAFKPGHAAAPGNKQPTDRVSCGRSTGEPPGLPSVSLDGRSIVWSRGEFDSDLMLVENFR